MKYMVYWVAGKRDGEILGEFESEREAIAFASSFYAIHEEEFDSCFGGVGIEDENGKEVEW